MGDIVRAIREGNEEEVIRLLDADPELLEREVHSRGRPLAWAVWSRQLGVVTLLIERGANINATGDGGRTALHYAARGGNEEVLALLLDKGAQTNSRDHYGLIPLIWARVNSHLGVVKMLVQHMGVQGLQERSDLGWTALHHAAEWGQEEVARFLLLAGADPSITDNEGRTPHAIAEENDTYDESFWEGRARCVSMFQVRPLTC
jgi:ankyrin repeat protein